MRCSIWLQCSAQPGLRQRYQGRVTGAWTDRARRDRMAGWREGPARGIELLGFARDTECGDDAFIDVVAVNGQDNVPVEIGSGHTRNLVIRENDTETCIGVEGVVEALHLVGTQVIEKVIHVRALHLTGLGSTCDLATGRPG